MQEQDKQQTNKPTMKIKISQAEATSLKKFIDPEGQVLVFGAKRRKEGTNQWQTPFCRVELATGKVVRNDWKMSENEIRHHLGRMIATK